MERYVLDLIKIGRRMNINLILTCREEEEIRREIISNISTRLICENTGVFTTAVSLL